MCAERQSGQSFYYFLRRSAGTPLRMGQRNFERPLSRAKLNSSFFGSFFAKFPAT
jgi:hypothetical protein